MDKFLTVKGNRKVLITAFLAALMALMLEHGGLNSGDYKELMLVLMGAFFGMNAYENKAKKDPPAA